MYAIFFTNVNCYYLFLQPKQELELIVLPKISVTILRRVSQQLYKPYNCTGFSTFSPFPRRAGHFCIDFHVNSLWSSWLIFLYLNSTRRQRYLIHWVQTWDSFHLQWYVCTSSYSIVPISHTNKQTNKQTWHLLSLRWFFFCSLVVDVLCLMHIRVVVIKVVCYSNHNHATNLLCNMLRYVSTFHNHTILQDYSWSCYYLMLPSKSLFHWLIITTNTHTHHLWSSFYSSYIHTHTCTYIHTYIRCNMRWVNMDLLKATVLDHKWVWEVIMVTHPIINTLITTTTTY